MLVLEAEAIQFEGRRAAILETRDHRLAAARIAAHRVDGDGIVRRQQAGIDQRPQQRNAAGRIAAGIGDFSRGPDLVGLVRREFRKAVSPVGGDPKRRRRVEHLGSRSAHAVDQGNGFLRGIVRQAEDDEIHLLHQRPLGAGILALLLGDAFHHDVVLQPKALLNAEPRRSGSAVNEHGGLGRGRRRFCGWWLSVRVMARSFRAGSFRWQRPLGLQTRWAVPVSSNARSAARRRRLARQATPQSRHSRSRICAGSA